MIVSLNGCSVTSSGYSYRISFPDNLEESFKLLPNPYSGEFFVDFPAALREKKIAGQCSPGYKWKDHSTEKGCKCH